MFQKLLLAALFVLAVGAAPATLPTSAPAAHGLPADERPPARSAECFPGSMYRKAVSSEDLWTGLDGTIVLPNFTPDPDRLDAKTHKPLDNPSVYVGGRAGPTEIDAGVSWEVIREADGTVSAQRKAFRPFWRNGKWATGPARPDLYFYPGDTIRMTCWTAAAGKLRFRVELLARAGQAPTPSPIDTHEVEFDAIGFGPGRIQQFKRVNAIDQVRNEGRPVQPTAARAESARWLQVSLLRGDERRAFVRERFTDMRCPDRTMIRVADESEDGAEKIDLVGR